MGGGAAAGDSCNSWRSRCEPLLLAKGLRLGASPRGTRQSTAPSAAQPCGRRKRASASPRA
eukprot:12472061-Alexandrium_andersonii.AAC.1